MIKKIFLPVALLLGLMSVVGFVRLAGTIEEEQVQSVTTTVSRAAESSVSAPLALTQASEKKAVETSQKELQSPKNDPVSLPSVVRDYSGKLRAQLQIKIDDTGRVQLVFHFNKKVLSDSALVSKKLSASERPLSLALDSAEIMWSNPETILVKTGLFLYELEKTINEVPLDIIWGPGLFSHGFRGKVTLLKSINNVGPADHLEVTDIDQAGSYISRLSLAPFFAKINSERRGNNAFVTISFNRDMILDDDAQLSSPPVPVKFSPSLPATAKWKGRSSLEFKTSNLTVEEYWQKVMDVSYRLLPTEGYRLPDGELLADLLAKDGNLFKNEIILDRFSPLELKQKSFDGNNYDLDLLFNRHVDQAKLLAGIHVELIDKKDGSGFQKVPFELVAVDNSSGGAVATLRVSARNGSIIRVVFHDLLSADGQGVFAKGDLEELLHPHFTIEETMVGHEDEYPWKSYFRLNIKERFGDLAELEKYVKLDPPLPFTLNISDQSLYVYAPFSFENKVKLSFLAGMPSVDGALDSDTTFEVLLKKNEGVHLSFTGRGRYLSKDLPLLVKLAGQNVSHVRLQAWRVYENNLATLINLEALSLTSRAKLGLQFSESILDRETEVGSTPGQNFERLLDLEKLFGQKPRGAYILKITPLVKNESGLLGSIGNYGDVDYGYKNSTSDFEDYSYESEKYLPVMISDLGLVAHVLTDRTVIWVNRLSTARAEAGVTLRFYDKANQIIGEGRTDFAGLYSQSGLDMDKVVFVSAEKGSDLTYLTFGQETKTEYGEGYNFYWQQDGYGKWFSGDGGQLLVSRGEGPDYPGNNYEAFVVMPRGVYKPGDTVKATAIVRDRELLPPTGNFPLVWRISDPDDRVIGQGSSALSTEGSLSLESVIPFSARTGSYRLSIMAPEATNFMGQAFFTVDDFVLPRLELALSPQEKEVIGSAAVVSLKGQAKYLFGADGSDLLWNLSVVASSGSFSPEGFLDFDFWGNENSYISSKTIDSLEGQLDEEGFMELNYEPVLDSEILPPLVNLDFRWQVQEDGGRWDSKRVQVNYFPREVLLGLKAKSSAQLGETLQYEVVALTSKGEPSLLSDLTVELSRVGSREYNEVEGGQVYRRSADVLSPITSLRIELKEGQGSFSLTPERPGLYELRISDPSSDLFLTRRFRIYGLETETVAEEARGSISLSLDRESYRPGDKAVVKVSAPFPGTLWLTLETEHLLYSRVVTMDKADGQFEIPVTDKIKTNAHITATIIRSLVPGQSAFRAMGRTSLEMDRSLNTLKIEAKVENRLKPASKASLKIKLSDSQGRPVAGEATVALVDEGVLSLTGFVTPDPLRQFCQSRRFMTLLYDLYDQILPQEERVLPFLVPGGGDGDGEGLFSPYQRRQELLSLFTTVKIPAEGSDLELDIPEYSGQGRLMVVATSGARFGNLSSQIRINRDLTVEPTLPLALAPGDSFVIPVRAFLDREAPGGDLFTLGLLPQGPLAVKGLLGQNEVSTIPQEGLKLKLMPGEGQTLFFSAVAIPEDEGPKVGVASLKFLLKSDKEEFSQTVETVVRPPFPRKSLVLGGQIENEMTEFVLPLKGFLPGTETASISLASGPAVEAARAAEYLSSYPYGCLEQTVSKAWLFVGADDLITETNLEGNRVQGLMTAVKRLATMQTYQGGFAYWPGYSEVFDWGSVYATHFLTEASRREELPFGLLEDALSWLRRYMGASYSGNESYDMEYILATKAYALYVLALNGEFQNGWINSLKDRYEGLLPSARIFLAGAESLRVKNSSPLKELLNQKSFDLSVDTLGYQYSSFESPYRNRALMLLVYSEIDPLSEEARALAVKVAEQGRGNYWSNTQENGLAWLALSNYMKNSAAGSPYEASLFSGGQVILKAGHKDGVTAGKKLLEPYLFEPLNLKVTGEGRPWYSLVVTGVPMEAPETSMKGLKLGKIWHYGDRKIDLGQKANLADLVFEKGDSIQVDLVLSAEKEMQNVVIADLVPGGFEIENTLASENYGEQRMELREDRVIIIVPFIGQEERLFSYKLRAVTSGEFVLPPATAEGMYQPENFAILFSGHLRINP